MLKDPFISDFEQVDILGFALRRSGENQFHVSFLHKPSGKPAQIRHQHAHNVVKDENADSFKDLWTDISALSRVNKLLISNKLSRSRNDKVPYGVGYRIGETYFDKKTLKYINTVPGDGLTCATYVMAVLETLGFRLFDIKSWQAEKDDAAWQTKILADQTRLNPADASHFDEARAKIGGPRFRPDQVVGAAHKTEWPLTQDQANDLGSKIVDAYNEKRPWNTSRGPHPSIR